MRAFLQQRIAEIDMIQQRELTRQKALVRHGIRQRDRIRSFRESVQTLRLQVFPENPAFADRPADLETRPSVLRDEAAAEHAGCFCIVKAAVQSLHFSVDAAFGPQILKTARRKLPHVKVPQEMVFSSVVQTGRPCARRRKIVHVLPRETHLIQVKPPAWQDPGGQAAAVLHLNKLHAG